MATASESDYFPSLDKCLAGNERLISWKTAYRLGFQSDTVVPGSPAHRFLESKETENILHNALNPFPPPSAATKSEFETKTAPIHVAQASSNEYNLEEIKKDALWLSEKVDIGELHALRITIIEWQERAATQLLQGGQGAQSNALTNESFSNSVFTQSTVNFLASTNGSAKPLSQTETEDARRETLLRVFLEEKENILKLHVDNGVAKDFRNEGPESKPWIDCLDCIKFIRQELSEDAPSRDPEVFKSDPTKQALLFESKMRRVVQALRAILSRTYASQSPSSADLVSEWFQLMGDVSFLQEQQSSTLDRDPSALECLVSLVSLSVLSLPQVINWLEETISVLAHGGVQYPELDKNGDYFVNDKCMTKIQIVLEGAALENITIAAPAVYAWGLITARIRDLAHIQRRNQERQQIQDGSGSEAGRPSNASQQDTVWQTRYRSLQDTIRAVEAQDDPPLFFAQAAVDNMNVYALIVAMGQMTTAAWDSDLQPGTAFESRFTLFGLLRESLAVVPYSADVLEAILSVFGSDQSANADAVPFSHVLARTFLDDDEHFKPRVLSQALVRYPYELSPMLRLLTKLASASATNPSGPPVVVQVLDNLERLTVMVPSQFRSYRLESEDEGSNEMVLTNALDVFRQRKASYGAAGQRSSRSAVGQGQRAVVTVPSGTSGMIVKEEPPRVLSLSHPHSGLEYLGLLLATRLPHSEFVPAIAESALDRPTAAEVVTLINSILLACLRQKHGVEEAIVVINSLSIELLAHGQQGIVPVIADTFEMELLAHLDQSPEEGSLDLAIACADFFNTLSQISPERVWALLSRSSLLGANGGASALAAVVGGTEVPLGQYCFLASFVRLFSNLLDDAVFSLVKRKSQVKKSTNRFDTVSEQTDLTPERAMKAVLTSYQRVVLDAFQGLRSVRFINPKEKQDISTSIMNSFTTILQWTYGLEDPSSPQTNGVHRQREKISAVLTKPAEMVLQAFASEENPNPLVSALGDLFSSGIDAAESDLPPHIRSSLVQQVQATSEFTSILARITRLRSPNVASNIATALLRGMSTFATLYAADPSFKAPLSNVLSELVQAVAGDGMEPISILAPLSPEASKAFLAVVSQLDRPLCEEDVEAKIWEFLAAVLGGRQQWFAIYLLTGTLPKTRTKATTDSSSTKAKSLLGLALDELTNITVLAPERAKAMLKFVSVAQNVWIWATNDIRSKTEFLKKAVEFLESLIKTAGRPSQSQVLAANELQMAALICDILAVNLHAGLETGDHTLITLLRSNIGFLAEHAATTDAYNRSLHRNLSENLRNKYSSCDLADFQRSSANPAPYGESFFYDLDLAATVLGHDSAWDPGATNGRNAGRGFVDEFRRANINLSLVDAQTTLLNSWKALASTLCECVGHDSVLESPLAKAAVACLKANSDANLEIPGTAAVLKTRAELAFGIMSKLVALKSTDPAMKDLLAAAYELVSCAPVNYDIAVTAEDLQYYRLLLQILFLAVQPYTYIVPETKFRPARDGKATDETEFHLLSPATGICLVEMVRGTIAPAFRALCGNLHTNIQLALPGDFALLTGLLQAVLSVHGVNTVHQQIAEAISNSSVVRGALSLYSWADQLAEVMDQDPVYGEVSLTFLLALSSVGLIAEQMAVDGILPQLANANLSNYFRKPGGKGPFEEPRRMFSIWNQGFLPLCLNLLDAVGPPMAAEVTTFLNSFPAQLRRAETALQPTVPNRGRPHAGDVTLGLIAEAHTLLVIGRILESDVARGAADGVNAAEIPPFDLNLTEIRGNVAALPRTSRSLSDKIVATNEREAVWATTAVPGSSDNLLVQKVIREMTQAGEVFGPVNA